MHSGSLRSKTLCFALGVVKPTKLEKQGTTHYKALTRPTANAGRPLERQKSVGILQVQEVLVRAEIRPQLPTIELSVANLGGFWTEGVFTTKYIRKSGKFCNWAQTWELWSLLWFKIPTISL